MNIKFSEIKSSLMIPTGLDLDKLEANYILYTLEKCNGNRTHTARRLNVTVRTIRSKIERYHQEGYFVPPARSKRPRKTGSLS